MNLEQFKATYDELKSNILQFQRSLSQGKKRLNSFLRFKRKQWPRPRLRLPYGIAIRLCHMALPYGSEQGAEFEIFQGGGQKIFNYLT